MSDNSCPNCSVAYGPDDMFCENCGYDFITGSLPVDAVGAPSPGTAPAVGTAPAPSVGGPESAAAPSVLNPDGGSGPGENGSEAPESAEAGAGEAALDVPRITIAVAVDKEYFDAVVNDGEIDFPDPVPSDQELELAGSELHIGRTSESRAIHPDIDVAALTEDQAVSSRHAVLRVANDGSYTVVDVGSTNGTFVDSVESEAITHGVPIEIKPGQALYVGAWTKLTILP